LETKTVSPRRWLAYAIVTTIFWGFWGALIEIPEKRVQPPLPQTLSYVVWALTMIPCSLVALKIINWKLAYDKRSILLGCTVGFLGAGGQLLLFRALHDGPAFLVFPIVSLYPVITVMLSVWLIHERASRRAWAGVVLAFPAIVFLNYSPPEGAVAKGVLWVFFTALVFVLWGLQAYVMKVSTANMQAESLFFYMMITAVALIPVALAMTDFSQPINWGFQGPWLAAIIQSLNAVGALCLVYAMRYGKAIIVAPMTALAPVLTIVVSLIIYRVVPGPVLVAGMVVAALSIYLMAE
jgi:drug/metabolite transporter (DMT)-like permease